MKDRTSVGWLRRFWPLVFPLCYLVHLAEEYWGGEGFVGWSDGFLGAQLTVNRFILINVVGWSLMLVGSVLAVVVTRLRWLVIVFAALVLVNGVAHLFGTLASGSYSPGVASGLLVYVPIGAATLARTRRVTSPDTFWLSAGLGALLNVVVFLVAFGRG
jgi:hypothetical protein